MLKNLGLPAPAGITLYPFPKIATSSFSIQLKAKMSNNRENDQVSTSSLAITCLSRSSVPSLFRQQEEESSSPSRNVERAARRRSVRYDATDDEEEEEYGHNQEIAMIEAYSQSVKEEALIVHALIDAEQVQILIFKGFSSSLSYGTWADPSRSILPARAEIKWIDRVKGPFDPSNIHFIDKHIPWETFKSNFLANL